MGFGELEQGEKEWLLAAMATDRIITIANYLLLNHSAAAFY